MRVLVTFESLWVSFFWRLFSVFSCESIRGWHVCRAKLARFCLSYEFSYQDCPEVSQFSRNFKASMLWVREIPQNSRQISRKISLRKTKKNFTDEPNSAGTQGDNYWLIFHFRGCGWASSPHIIDILMGLFRGAVFDHGGVPKNSPLALMGHFACLMGRFSALMGRFPECLHGPFSLLRIPWKAAHEEKLVSHRHICAIPRFATYRAIIVRYPPKKKSTKELRDTIATSIARYEKYRCWASTPRLFWDYFQDMSLK